MLKKDKKPVVALVYDAIYPYVKGGAEKRIYETGRRLAAAGWEVRLYGMKFWKGPDCVRRDGMTFCGLCKARPFYAAAGRRSIIQALVFGASCAKMIGQKFDAIDCCGFPYFSLFFCRLAAWLRRRPLLATIHEVWGVDYWKKYLGHRWWRAGAAVENICLALPDAVISVSSHTTARLKKTTAKNKRIYTVPNGIDLPAIEKSRPCGPAVDIIYAGRLSAHKNVDLMLRAVAILKKEIPGIRAAVIGAGPEKIKLELLAKELDVEKNVEFCGFIENRDEFYGRLKMAKVFAFPSIREGFGIAVIEANACGLPVAAIDHPENAARDLIKPGINGALTLAEPAAFAGALNGLMSANIKKEIVVEQSREYDWNRAAKALQKIYGKASNR